MVPLFDDEKVFKKIHMIGFSLGAHVASYAANIVRTSLGLVFDRITGNAQTSCQIGDRYVHYQTETVVVSH